MMTTKKKQTRPFRLYLSKKREYMAHRNYATKGRAFDKALVLCYESKVGTIIELLNYDTGALLFCFVRINKGVLEYGGNEARGVVSRTAQEILRDNEKEAARKAVGRANSAHGRRVSQAKGGEAAEVYLLSAAAKPAASD